MKISLIGNFCGPYWSDGKLQSSVANPKKVALSEFDSTCRTHDIAFAKARSSDDSRSADRAFIKANKGKGFLRSSAALAVGTLGPLFHNNTMAKKKKNTNLRGAQNNTVQSTALIPYVAPIAVKQKKPKNKASIQVKTAPTTIGTSIRCDPPKSKTLKNGLTISGRDFVCAVVSSGSNTFQLGALFPINPAYLPGTTLGNICRTYEKFRFRKAVFHFITQLSTSSTGEIVLCTSDQVTSPCVNGSSSTFMSRVMTQGRAVMGPLWTNHTLEFPNTGLASLVDVAQTDDVNANILGELQVYVATTGIAKGSTLGYIILDYTVDFIHTMYQPHSMLMPYPTGAGFYVGLYDRVNPVAPKAWKLGVDQPLTPYATGSIFKMVLNSTTSIYPTGMTPSNGYMTNTTYAADVSSLTDVPTASTFTLVDGMVLYLVKVATDVVVYVSLESAMTGSTTGQIFYNSSGTSNGAYYGIVYFLHYSSVDISIPS